MPEVKVFKDGALVQSITSDSYLVLYTDGDRIKFTGDVSLKFLLSAIPLNRIMEAVGASGKRQ